LSWLKIHNPKYYGDVTLDVSRLRSLPVDDVPDEILATIHQDHNDDHVQTEEDAYVPSEDVMGELALFL